MGLHYDRDLTKEEMIQSAIDDMSYAKYIGFQLVRTQHAISPEIFCEMRPYAEKIGIPLTIGMHHPHNPTFPVWKEYLEIMKESDGWLGMVPDFSIFAEHPHALHIRQAVEEFGCREEKFDEIAERHTAGEPKEEILKGDYTDAEKHFVEEVFEMYGDGHAHIEWLDEILPYTKYIHGKFWYMREDEVDHTISYDRLLPIIKSQGIRAA